MEEEFVTYKGKKFHVFDNKLDLSEYEITDINMIEGLEHLTNLNDLILAHNSIKEIKGLETLTKLQYLDLSYNEISEIIGLETLTNLLGLRLDNNQIQEITGLEHLTRLVDLWLGGNRIKEIKGLENLVRLKKLYLIRKVTVFTILKTNIQKMSLKLLLVTTTSMILLILGDRSVEYSCLKLLKNRLSITLFFSWIITNNYNVTIISFFDLNLAIKNKSFNLFFDLFVYFFI